MSYILAALKKADQEREIGAVPNLATPQEVAPPQTRSYRWPLIIAALLSINIVLVVVLLKEKRTEDAFVPVAAQVQPAQQAAPTSAPPAQLTQPASEDLAATAQTAEAPAQVIQQASEKPAEIYQAAAAPAQAGISATRSAGELVVLPEPAYPRESTFSIPQDQAPDMQANAATGAQDNLQLQGWYDLSDEFRKGVDLPRLDIHVYSDEPEKRFIMVDLKKYREGQTLASGLLLEEILPGGMVMSYRGERFRVEK